MLLLEGTLALRCGTQRVLVCIFIIFFLFPILFKYIAIERYASLSPMYIRGARYILLVFDLSTFEEDSTLQEISKWHSRVVDNVMPLLFGT